MPGAGFVMVSLPVFTVQLGCSVVITGAEGTGGAGFMVTGDAVEIQPSAFFTVTWYVPGVILMNVPLVFE